MGPHYLSIASEEHQSGLVEALENCLRSQALVDCTLAAEGQYLKAHKVILSARSPYLQMLFKQECEKNPILILKDVKYEYLKLVVDFVYHGEVHVLENQLNAFLDVAESLQIKGLDAYNNEPTRERTLPEPTGTSPNVHESQDCKSGVEIIDDEIDCGVIDKINSAEEIRVREQSPVYEQRDTEDGESRMIVTIQSTYSMAPCESPAPVAMMENEHEWPLDSPSPLSVASSANVKSEQLTESTETCSEMFTDEEDFMGFDCVPIEQQAVTQTNGAGSSSSERCQTPENDKPMDAITEDVTGTAKESCSSGSTTGNKQLYPCILLQRMHWKKQGESLLEYSPTTPTSPTTAYSTVTLQVPSRTRPDVNSAPSRGVSNVNRTGSKTCLRTSLVVSNAHPDLSKQPKPKTSQGVHKSKRHVCPECHKQFDISSRLVSHRRVHTGERPYTCPVCWKCFSRIDTLTRHRRVHTGEKPYLCKYCEKSFVCSDTLKVHMRIHTGELPYPCGECGKQYPSMSALAQHKPVHEETYKFTCDKCGKLFKWRSAMISHWFKKHEKKK